MIRYQYQPLPPQWPTGKRSVPRSSTFRAPSSKTWALLRREIEHLAKDLNPLVTIEAGYTEGQIRKDGQPREDAKLWDPAVIISFESRYGPVRYPCDTFSVLIDNLRAIALSLAALRAVDRYGVTRRGEQYIGWKALPAAGEGLSAVEAREWLRSFAEPGLGQVFEDASLYRIAAKRVHPDTPTGSREQWERLQRVKAVLGL